MPNHEVICKYFLTGYHYRNGDTFFAQVKEVLPGYYVVVDSGKNWLQLFEYWHLPHAESFRPKENEVILHVF
jgi:asparagine synthetase B (glutamine-hydrolysing)